MNRDQHNKLEKTNPAQADEIEKQSLNNKNMITTTNQ